MTDHLQLLLRKAGYYLHTSAEKEVVRTIKEKTCYLALNPQKEEKDQSGAWEEFRLPDGKVMQVRPPFPARRRRLNHNKLIWRSWARSDSWPQKSCSTPNLLAKNTQECIR